MSVTIVVPRELFEPPCVDAAFTDEAEAARRVGRPGSARRTVAYGGPPNG